MRVIGIGLGVIEHLDPIILIDHLHLHIHGFTDSALMAMDLPPIPWTPS
jgi:hypothetical protein